MQPCVSLRLPEDLAHLGMVRRVSREMLSSFGVGPQDLDDIEFLVGELATNAARHAHSNFYYVEIELLDDTAVVTVSDRGVGFQRGLVPPVGTFRPDASANGGRFGGWGLPLVEMLADNVEFLPSLPHGTTVRAEKRLNNG